VAKNTTSGKLLVSEVRRQMIIPSGNDLLDALLESEGRSWTGSTFSSHTEMAHPVLKDFRSRRTRSQCKRENSS
jgi:hypothetical protein